MDKEKEKKLIKEIIEQFNLKEKKAYPPSEEIEVGEYGPDEEIKFSN